MKQHKPFSAPSDDYRNNWDAIFGKQPVKNIGSQSKSEK